MAAPPPAGDELAGTPLPEIGAYSPALLRDPAKWAAASCITCSGGRIDAGAPRSQLFTVRPKSTKWAR